MKFKTFRLWMALAASLALALIPLLLLFGIGCDKPASPTKVISYPPPTRTVGTVEVVTAMAEMGIATSSFSLPDAKYLLPTLRWIEGDFSRGLFVFQSEMGISHWSTESNDCDKFATACTFYGKWLNHSTPNRNVAAALAIGEVYYLQGGDRARAHAINFFVVAAGDTLQLVFYEPQRRAIVTLTEVERLSVFFYKL